MKTRFAPSPTGYLHLGSARTTLFNLLYTLSQQGSWFIRIEDTDQNRLVPEAFESLLVSMGELGFHPDEGVSLEGPGEFNDFYKLYSRGEHGPYIQSQRKEIYHQHAQNLIDKDLAYWDYLTGEERSQLQELKQATKQPINYHKLNLGRFGVDAMTVPVATIVSQNDSKPKPALRYKFQRNNTLITKDLLLGETSFDLNLMEDPVFLKSDGFPTYALAHLIDDKLMNTTHVIRSQEWYPSLPLHIQMFDDYWGEHLEYIHVPFIMGEEGTKKMSKRDGNVAMQDYLDKGFLPEAIINYLAFLGWNPGTEKELYLDATDF